MTPSPIDPGYYDTPLARAIRRSGKFGRDLDAQIPGAGGPGFNPTPEPNQLLRPPLPSGAMQPQFSSGAALTGGGQPRPQPAKRSDPGAMVGSAASPAAPQTGGASPPVTGAAPPAPNPVRQPGPGTDYAAMMAPLAQRQAALNTPVGQTTPVDLATGAGGAPGERPVPPKGVGGALQRVALALLSATKLAPYAQQIVHPMFTEQLASNQAQLAGIQSQLGTLKEASTAEEQQQRGGYYEGLNQERIQAAKERAAGTEQAAITRAEEQAAARKQKAFEAQVGKRTPIYRDPTEPPPQGWEEVPGGDPSVPGKKVYVPGAFAVVTKELAPYMGGMYQEGMQAPREDLDKALKTYNDQREKIAVEQAKPTSASSAQMDTQAQSLLAKLGPVPSGAFTDMRVLGPLIDKSPNLTDTEKSQLRAHFLDKTSPATSGTGGILRIEALGDTRQATFVNTQSGQEQTMTMTEFADKERKNPGQWVEAGKAIPVQKAGAVYRSLHQSIGQVRNTLPALGTLDAGTRAALANALRNPNPESALQEFMQGTIARMTLTPQQEDAINAIRTLGEDSLSLRMLVGMGQGSETQRQAILNTLPNAVSASPHMMQGQLDNVERLLTTLEGGLPGLGRAGTAPPSLGPTAAGPAPSTAAQAEPPLITDQAAFNALTKGTRYRERPGGRVFTKP